MSEIDDAVKRLSNEGISRIKLGVTDIDGILRGKYISLDKFVASYNGLGFCDVIFGWDIGDVLYDNAGTPDGTPAIPIRRRGSIQYAPNHSVGTRNCSVPHGPAGQKRQPAFSCSAPVVPAHLDRAAASGYKRKVRC